VKKCINMSSELTIEISPINIEEWEPNSQSILSQVTEENLIKIRAYILDNLAGLDGGPSISEFEVANLKFNSEMKRGSFRLKFQIDRQYCCSDTQACSNDYLDFDFSVEHYKLKAHTEYFDWSLTN
jgi:hypothetical protein